MRLGDIIYASSATAAYAVSLGVFRTTEQADFTPYDLVATKYRVRQISNEVIELVNAVNEARDNETSLTATSTATAPFFNQ